MRFREGRRILSSAVPLQAKRLSETTQILPSPTTSLLSETMTTYWTVDPSQPMCSYLPSYLQLWTDSSEFSCMRASRPRLGLKNIKDEKVYRIKNDVTYPVDPRLGVCSMLTRNGPDQLGTSAEMRGGDARLTGLDIAG